MLTIKHNAIRRDEAYELAMLAANCQHMEDELDIKYFKSFNETTREFLKAKQKEKTPMHIVIELLKDRKKTLLEAYERYSKFDYGAKN